MSGHPITYSASHKRLGVTSSGSWSDHILNLLNVAKNKLNLFRGLKYLLHCKCLETIYVSFIRSSLEYADNVWDSLDEGIEL